MPCIMARAGAGANMFFRPLFITKIHYCCMSSSSYNNKHCSWEYFANQRKRSFSSNTSLVIQSKSDHFQKTSRDGNKRIFFPCISPFWTPVVKKQANAPLQPREKGKIFFFLPPNYSNKDFLRKTRQVACCRIKNKHVCRRVEKAPKP